MILAISSLVMAMSAVSDPVAQPRPDEPERRIYDAAFVPLPSSEEAYSALGPVGPFYPQAAIRQTAGGVSVTTGDAVLECVAKADGALDRCRVISETPQGFNFGPAAKALAERRRILVKEAAAGDGVVRVRVPFKPGAPVQVSR